MRVSVIKQQVLALIFAPHGFCVLCFSLAATPISLNPSVNKARNHQKGKTRKSLLPEAALSIFQSQRKNSDSTSHSGWKVHAKWRIISLKTNYIVISSPTFTYPAPCNPSQTPQPSTPCPSSNTSPRSPEPPAPTSTARSSKGRSRFHLVKMQSRKEG